MSKQKVSEAEHRVIHPIAEVVGAYVLTALSVLVSFEAIIEHHSKSTHETSRPAMSEMFARADGKGETARLPEEFDIGLQTPHVSGL